MRDQITCDLLTSFFLEHPSRCKSNFPRPLLKHTMTMSQTMTEEQLRELIQGPQDVEWKYAPPPLSSDCWFPITHAAHLRPPPPRRMMTDMRCAESVKKSSLVSSWVHYKSPNHWKPFKDSESPMCTFPAPLQLAIGVANLTETRPFARSLICSNRVCIRDAKEAFSVKPRFPDVFKYMVVDLADSEEQNLIRYFPA